MQAPCPNCGQPLAHSAHGAVLQPASAVVAAGGIAAPALDQSAYAAGSQQGSLLGSSSKVVGTLEDQIASARKKSHNKRSFVKGSFFLLVLLLMLLVATISGADEWVYTHVIQPAVQAITSVFVPDATESFARTAFNEGGSGIASATAKDDEASSTSAGEATAKVVVFVPVGADELVPRSKAAERAYAEVVYKPNITTIRDVINNSMYGPKPDTGSSNNTAADSADKSNTSDGADKANDKSLANLIAVARGDNFAPGIGSWDLAKGSIYYTYCDLGGDDKLDLIVASKSSDNSGSASYRPLLAYAYRADGSINSLLQGLGSQTSTWIVNSEGNLILSDKPTYAGTNSEGNTCYATELFVYSVKDGELCHVLTYSQTYAFVFDWDTWKGSYVFQSAWKDYSYDLTNWESVANSKQTHEAISEDEFNELAARYGSDADIKGNLEWFPLFEEESDEVADEGFDAVTTESTEASATTIETGQPDAALETTESTEVSDAATEESAEVDMPLDERDTISSGADANPSEDALEIASELA